jgi:hypothetical protein
MRTLRGQANSVGDSLGDLVANGTTDSTALKVIISFLTGIVMTGAAAFIAYPHDLPTKNDVQAGQVQTQKQLDTMQAQINLEEDEITTLRINVAKIAAKLNVHDGP